jgi:cobalt-zinc-cadmium efflux system protein
VRDAIASVEGVAGVHDLHIWTITSGFVALSAHVVEADGDAVDRNRLLSRVRRSLAERFGIEHTTIQVEPADFDDCDGPC